jgi:ribokinase
MPRVVVVGHVEWVEFARVPRMPRPGEIVHASEWWEEAGGGGAVAAVQLAKLAGGVEFFTALAGDERGRRAAARLEELGVTVHAAPREGAQRRGFVHLDDDDHERTITILGDRIVPRGEDDLPWERLDGADAVYFTGGDVGALRQARRARRLVATPRAFDTLRASRIKLDALVRSAKDPGEQHAEEALDPPPDLVVSTAGREGGEWVGKAHGTGHWKAAELPGPPRDAYGAGDSFAAGLTFALGADLPVEQAVRVAARCGAHKLAGRAAYDNQLTAERL